MPRLARRYCPDMQAIALQYAPSWLDKPASHRTVEAMLETCRPESGAFVVLPEMADTGWSMDVDAVVAGDSTAWASRLAIRFGIHLQMGFARRVDRPPGAANAAVIAHPDGGISPVYEKVHPFGFTPEPDHFAAGSEIVLDRVGPFQAAPSICYDLRFPELHRLAVAEGAEVLSIGANWPIERSRHWRALVIARAVENQAFVIAANRTGSDPTFRFGGGSLIVGPDGTVLAEGGEAPEAVSATLDRSTLRQWRAEFPALRDRRPELLGALPVRRDDRSFPDDRSPA